MVMTPEQRSIWEAAMRAKASELKARIGGKRIQIDAVEEEPDGLLQEFGLAMLEVDALEARVRTATDEYEKADAEADLLEARAVMLRLYAVTGRLLLAREMDEDA
jgi:hypothetical protein